MLEADKRGQRRVHRLDNGRFMVRRMHRIDRLSKTEV